LLTEDLLEKERDDFQWPSFDERTAACLCYTSGTTGNPKGALYKPPLDDAARIRRRAAPTA